MTTSTGIILPIGPGTVQERRVFIRPPADATTPTAAEAFAEYHAMRADRHYQWVAAARVVGLDIELLACDAPNAEHLKSVPGG